LFRRLKESRPRDLNLYVACSNNPQTLTPYERAEGVDGCSTASSAAANDLAEALGEMRPRLVEATTLARICEEHVAGSIDFLKIDVEAYEREVIEGADFRRWRPRVLIVEATWPVTPRAVYETWEPLLLQSGYVFAVFDGLNRFYVRHEEADELAPRLELPISPFDNYELDRYMRRIEGLQADVHGLASGVKTLEARLRLAEAHSGRWRRLYESRMARSVHVSRRIVAWVRALARRTPHTD
jgi:FkbM family methyltransferase